ncbi:hypothetical protein [Colwellia echini]|uniref:Uncharacterized protein n=1 Tax=Colwellia echini TaxID=1982103 RepID=A0ABY3MZL2_9GAMM|nr:hypothetical protein [Colwellia echini]TYK66614.1 hypothetical protein CWS31_004575 [Colwellia echini]
MKNKLITFLTLLFLTLIMATTALAMPKTNIRHQKNTAGFAEVQVQNETAENLICHVELDGHKFRFKLKPYGLSKWYTSTDTRFNHTHFSIWCDYLQLHPQYQ